MKYLFFILIPLSAFAQPKKVNTAIFPAIPQDSIIARFVRAGYEIKSTTGLVSTEYKNIEPTTRVRFIVRESTTLTGELIDVAVATAFKMDPESTVVPISKTGTFGSSMIPAFKEMARVAGILSTEITWLKK